ncbi:DUF58 domain-containing protein [Rhodopirellula halodulae]|uniref:DUF58 domain-containing protein n=1 Tax=Rhodopirellula halodulae TaxID=2894198 RepID=UPI001E304FE9|nr:DUF58 domain-containing protein [Rhodopirellula sp. JC737]MCC9656950.1 DUF58 domain-containing protein [Rhodopirellula sp. JC737]
MSEQHTPREFLDPAVLAGLAGLPLFARRAMRGNVSGRHTSPMRGASVEFAEYRKYVPGDDLRRLDWRAHGRTDRYYVKEFEADTNLRLQLVLDTSGSMDYGSGELTKLQYARRIAAAIGYLAVQQGDAVGLSCVANGITHHLPARRNPAHLKNIFDTLEVARCQGETHLVEVLHELAETTAQAAMVIVISDFFVDPDPLRNCLEHLRFRKHDVSLFHLLDPMELNFEFSRPTRFLDMEGGTAIFAEPSEIAARYHEALRGYLERVQEIVSSSGIDYLRVSIDQPYPEVLTNFLTRRAMAKGGR